MSERLTDTELAALTALVNADTMMMDAENAARLSQGQSLAFSSDVEWPARKALEIELRNRRVVGGNDDN